MLFLGCTENEPFDQSVRCFYSVFDTAVIHAKRALKDCNGRLILRPVLVFRHWYKFFWQMPSIYTGKKFETKIAPGAVLMCWTYIYGDTEVKVINPLQACLREDYDGRTRKNMSKEPFFERKMSGLTHLNCQECKARSNSVSKRSTFDLNII